MFLFHSNVDIMVDGSLDMTWVTNNGIQYKKPVRISLYTDWNAHSIETGCNDWRDQLIRRFNGYSSVSITGNSDTIHHILDSFKKVSHVGIEIIKGTPPNV